MGRRVRIPAGQAHLPDEALAVSEAEVERARRRLERLRRAAHHHCNGAAGLRQDAAKGLSVCGADTQAQP